MTSFSGHHRFWHSLRLRSAMRRHHPPQTAVLSQICCFGLLVSLTFVIFLQVLLLSLHVLCVTGTVFCRKLPPTNIPVLVEIMSGRSGFQTWSNNSYKHTSPYHPGGSGEDMWDEQPSSMAHLTQVFHNQSLKNTADDDWDAWDGNCTRQAVNVPANCNSVGNYGVFDYQHDSMWQSSASGQRPDRFGQQNEPVHSSGDDAPFDMKIPSRQIGLVLGKGGTRIRELQMSSGAKINVKRNDIDASGMVLVTLGGDVAARSSAKRMIDELIENDSYSNAGRTDNFQMRQTSKDLSDGGGFHDATQLTIAPNMLGAVIGRGGQKIREIEEKTQTKIKIGDRYGLTVDVTISGSEGGRQRAKQIIEDVMQSDSDAGWMPKSERPDFSGRHANSQQKPGSGSTELQVPTNMLGAIIGRAGQNIKDISDKTQTKIRIADDRSGAMVDITITGSEDGRLQATSLIEDSIQSAETRNMSNSEGSSFNSCHIGNQHKSGFGDYGHSEAAGRYVPDSERSVFGGDFNTGSQQRSGFGNFDHREPSERSDRSGFGGDFNTGSQQRSGFGNFDHHEPSERSFGNSGRSSFGGSSGSRQGFGGSSGVINWDRVKELSQQHEQEKWKDYPPIKKNFYIEDADVANMEPEEIAAIREQNNNIMVSCDEDGEVRIPNPVRTFDEGFLHYPDILSELKRAGFTKPSPIQMQGWPIALQGLDLIGIAQTGTGKTLAFLLPAFIHIEGQPVPREKRGGPNVLVLSPTRELALQVSVRVIRLCDGLLFSLLSEYDEVCEFTAFLLTVH